MSNDSGSNFALGLILGTAIGIGIGLGHLKSDGVEQQRDAGVLDHLLQQNGIKDERVALGIAVQVFHQQLTDDAALPRPAVVVAHVGRGAQYPEAYLA